MAPQDVAPVPKIKIPAYWVVKVLEAAPLMVSAPALEMVTTLAVASIFWMTKNWPMVPLAAPDAAGRVIVNPAVVASANKKASCWLMLYVVVFVEPGSFKPRVEYNNTFEKVVVIEPPRIIITFVNEGVIPVLLLFEAAIAGVLPAGTINFPETKEISVPSSENRLLPKVDEERAFGSLLVVRPEIEEPPGLYW